MGFLLIDVYFFWMTEIGWMFLELLLNFKCLDSKNRVLNFLNAWSKSFWMAGIGVSWCGLCTVVVFCKSFIFIFLVLLFTVFLYFLNCWILIGKLMGFSSFFSTGSNCFWCVGYGKRTIWPPETLEPERIRTWRNCWKIRL